MSRLLLLPVLTLGLLVALTGEQSKAAQKPQRPNAPGGGGPEVSIPLAPESVLKIRVMEPADGGFDEKGNIKTPSAKDKLKAKGDTPAEQKLPGYKGSIDRLKPGDVVRVTLSNARPDPKDKEKKVYTASGKQFTGKLMSVDSARISIQGGPPAAGGKPIPDTTPATMIEVLQSAPAQQQGRPPKKNK